MDNSDLDLFKQDILSSSLFSNPHPTVDGYADQMETEITSVLDKLAPLKTGRRSGPRRARNWLSPEAIEAKKQRRRLERRWKASNAEPDRLSYRAACSSTNKLINKSRAASNVECINEASKNPKRLWSNRQPSSHFFTRLHPVSSSHLAYLNRWQIPLLPFSVKRLSPSKSLFLSNYVAVPLLLILISHIEMNYSRTSRLSPQLKYLNCSNQCQTNRHNLTTSQLHW